jgi:hypothetical protein
MRHGILFVALLALSGCGPRVVDTGERSFAFQGNETGSPAEKPGGAMVEAERLCAAQGRKARLVAIEGSRAIIHCVDWHPKVGRGR